MLRPTLFSSMRFRRFLGTLALGVIVSSGGLSARAETPLVDHEVVHVVDGDGQPAPFAVVPLEFVDAISQRALLRQENTAGATGYCDAALSSLADKDFDWQTTERVPCAVSARGDRFGIASGEGVCALHPLATIRVRFVDAEDKPIGGVNVFPRSLRVKAGRMVEGWVPEASQPGLVAVASWHLGPPRTSTQGILFGGTRTLLPNQKEGIPIRAFRCVRCGFLKFYARALG